MCRLAGSKNDREINFSITLRPYRWAGRAGIETVIMMEKLTFPSFSRCTRGHPEFGKIIFHYSPGIHGQQTDPDDGDDIQQYLGRAAYSAGA